jgi:hypothetical protein
LEAYYRLGLSLAKAGDLHDEIQFLETDLRPINDLPIKRFELVTFYLCAGRRKSAKKQYRLPLENGDFSLAEELLKLMKKRGSNDRSCPEAATIADKIVTAHNTGDNEQLQRLIAKLRCR